MFKIRNYYLKEKPISEKVHQFLLLHHFKIENNNYFKSYNELLFSNDKNKYSVFGYFDSDFRIRREENANLSYVFLLEYPDIKSYIYFEQRENPLTAEHNTDVGLTIFESTMPSGDRAFSGFTKYGGSYNGSYLDGFNNDTYKNDWYYAIGQRVKWKEDQIPAHVFNETPKLVEVNLWVEIHDLSILDKFKNFYSCRGNNQYSLNYLFCLCVIMIK